MQNRPRATNLRRLVNQLSHRAGQAHARQLAAELLAEVRGRLAKGEAAEAICGDLRERHASTGADTALPGATVHQVSAS